jgi:hypothetical protein
MAFDDVAFERISERTVCTIDPTIKLEFWNSFGGGSLKTIV